MRFLHLQQRLYGMAGIGHRSVNHTPYIHARQGPLQQIADTPGNLARHHDQHAVLRVNQRAHTMVKKIHCEFQVAIGKIETFRQNF